MHGPRGLLLHVERHIAVHIHRQTDGAMPQHIRDDLGMHALAQQQHRGAVAQGVELHMRNTGAYEQGRVAGANDVPRLAGLADGIAEHQVKIVPCLAERQAFGAFDAP